MNITAKQALKFLRERFPPNGPQPVYFRVLTRSHRDFATMEDAQKFAIKQGAEAGLFVDVSTAHVLPLHHGREWWPGGFEAATYIILAEHYNA